MKNVYTVEPMLKKGEFWPYKDKEYLAGYYISYKGSNTYSFRGYERESVERICSFLNEAYERGKNDLNPLTHRERIQKLEAEITELKSIRDRLVRLATT